MALRDILDEQFTILMEHADNIPDDKLELLDAVKDGNFHKVLLTTNELVFEGRRGRACLKGRPVYESA